MYPMARYLSLAIKGNPTVRSPLPDHADIERVTAWAVDAQRRHLGW